MSKETKGKTGRRKFVDITEVRNLSVSMVVSESEKAWIDAEAKAAGLGRSAWLVKRLLERGAR